VLRLLRKHGGGAPVMVLKDKGTNDGCDDEDLGGLAR
jgi:hypothetical protein